jgi:hypothetical protein
VPRCCTRALHRHHGPVLGPHLLASHERRQRGLHEGLYQEVVRSRSSAQRENEKELLR